MNRLDHTFTQNGRKKLAVYFTAGFPRLNDTRDILRALQARGADIVEIGMPFSDPLADGETIQHSSAVALRNGMTIERLFEQLEGVREEIHVPLVLMGYLNPVLQFGVEKFLDKCRSVGIDGLIIPDLPVELYETEYRAMFEKYGIYPVLLATPRTPEARIRRLAAAGKGFLYVVSSASTTGATGSFSTAQLETLENISRLDLGIPLMAGFGIHDKETFRSATRHLEGGIVGSAFIKLLERKPSVESAVQEFLDQLLE